MNNFDKVYNYILEGKANSADKKGSKHGWNKHRNKWESKQSSKTSRRQGKKATMEEGYGMGEEAENSVDYRKLFNDLHRAVEECFLKIGSMNDIDMVEDDLGEILFRYRRYTEEYPNNDELETY